MNEQFDVANAVVELVKKGADINARDAHCMTPLKYALKRDSTPVIGFLLNRGARVTFAFDPIPTLMFANGEWTSLLIEKGANINDVDIYGRTPVMRALRSGHARNARILIEKGADLCLTDGDGLTAYDYALDHCRSTELIQVFELIKQKTTSLVKEAMARDDAEMIKSCMRAGADISTYKAQSYFIASMKHVLQDFDYFTPLFWAVLEGSYKDIKSCITKGSDVNSALIRQNPLLKKMTLLMLAIKYCGYQCVKLLVDKDAFINVQNTDGQTPLMIAAQLGKSEVVELLLAKGADTALIDAHGKTALMLAAENGYEEIAATIKAKPSCNKQPEQVTAIKPPNGPA